MTSFNFLMTLFLSRLQGKDNIIGIPRKRVLSCRINVSSRGRSICWLNSRVISLLNEPFAVSPDPANRCHGNDPKCRGIRPRGKRALGMPTGGGALMCAVRAIQPRSLAHSSSLFLSLSLVISKRLRGASTLITYPYTRIPTVCLPTDGSNE